MPTPYGSRGGMVFGAEELRVLRRALALAPHSGPASTEDAQDCLRLAESLDEAMREGARLRAFLVADLARYRAALPGTAAGYLTLLEEVLGTGYRPAPDDLAALRALRGNPVAATLLSRCRLLTDQHPRTHRATPRRATPVPAPSAPTPAVPAPAPSVPAPATPVTAATAPVPAPAAPAASVVPVAPASTLGAMSVSAAAGTSARAGVAGAASAVVAAAAPVAAAIPASAVVAGAASVVPAVSASALAATPAPALAVTSVPAAAAGRGLSAVLAVPRSRVRLSALPGVPRGEDGAGSEGGGEKKPGEKPAPRPAPGPAPAPGRGPREPAAPQPARRPIPTPGEVFPRRKPAQPPTGEPEQRLAVC